MSLLNLAKRNETDAYLRKQAVARLFDENIALENKAFNVADNMAGVRLMNKILILLIVVGYGIAGTEGLQL